MPDRKKDGRTASAALSAERVKGTVPIDVLIDSFGRERTDV